MKRNLNTMRKIFIILTALFAIATQSMAQKFIDVYQKGKVAGSFFSADIDSISISGTDSSSRRIHFWRAGNLSNSFVVIDVDSIKVFRTDSLPSDAQIKETLANSGKAVWCSIPNDLPPPARGRGPLGRGSEERDTIRPQLNFNAIAQGYSCDKVAAYLYDIGVKDMLVDIGEIFCDGLNPQGKPWRIGIDKPEDGNNTPGAELNGIWESDGSAKGVVTSGNYRKFYIKDGVKYSHTIDPRTGYPVQHKLLSATVIAPTAMKADAYATYCMVIGTEKAQEFILSRPDLEACLISEEIWTSPGFKLQ